MKKISVIVPCYNATKWLPKCFLSLASQTIGIQNLELIFVDDASVDSGKTWKMLQLFERAYPESVVLIHLEKNMRQGGARNFALAYAGGEYLAFVDADDFVAEEYLETVYQKAKQTDADIVQFGYYYYTDRLGAMEAEREVAEEIRIQLVEERKRFLLRERITYGCWNKLYRRELIKRAGVKFAEHTIYEEPLFVYPLLFYAKTFVIMEDRFYFYRQNQCGTMWSDMRNEETLMMHAHVQRMVWDFMKQTPFFEVYYQEIKLYFLHSYLYETLLFAKQRGFVISMECFRKLEECVLAEVDDYQSSSYAELIPVQMVLYRMIGRSVTEKELQEYIEQL